MAHVLFLDVVGYSRLSTDQQTRLVRRLSDLVRGTDEFARADQEEELISLPTGDGMALVFLRDPLAPARCALEIARLSRDQPEIRLRMGIHSGPVYHVEDINAQTNVSGGGINTAQRVMDCGDAGHILLSRTVAEVLSELSDWAPLVHDLGECEVKHGVRLHLFSLYTEELGNPELPEVVAGGHGPVLDRKSAARGVPAASTTGHQASATALRIALLYKRNAQPDEHLLKTLEVQLQARGYQVFIDRHLTIGEEWAKEIARQVRTADAVVPLLSATSVHSEMLAYEVQIAHEAAQEQQGKPRLCPVRVNYSGSLPEPLASYLGPLHYSLWESTEDDERLVNELIVAVQSPRVSTAALIEKLEPVGGAVPLDSQFYVVRPTDDAFRAAIARRDSIVLVKGARQMGKTSLLARGLQQAREAGARVVLTDFQKLNASHLASAETLFLTLAEWMARQLQVETLPDRVWNTRSGANINFEWYLRREVMEKIAAPIVWGLDEVDSLFTCDFAREIFGLFRSWHNERALDPTGPWSRLTLAIAYATEAHLFITDVNQSPFNVGTRLTLEDFTFEQVSDLNRRYGSPLRDDAEIARLYRLLNGQPYLVRRGLHEMVTHGLDIAAFEAQAGRDEGIFGDHLRRILVLLARDPDLSDVVRGVLRARTCPTPESFYRLRSAGLMTGESARDVRPRCQLYATYLERHLL